MRRPVDTAVGVFARDRSAATAVEFSLVAMPLLLLILFVLQIGLYFINKMALENGVTMTADTLRSAMDTGSSPIGLPTSCDLKTQIINNASTLVVGNLIAEIRPLSALDAATVSITDCLVTMPQNTVLALRTQYNVQTFLPGVQAVFTLSSSALIRRQAQ